MSFYRENKTPSSSEPIEVLGPLPISPLRWMGLTTTQDDPGFRTLQGNRVRPQSSSEPSTRSSTYLSLGTSTSDFRHIGVSEFHRSSTSILGIFPSLRSHSPSQVFAGLLMSFIPSTTGVEPLPLWFPSRDLRGDLVVTNCLERWCYCYKTET